MKAWETEEANDARRQRIKRLKKALNGSNLTEEEVEEELAKEKAEIGNMNTFRAEGKERAEKAWKDERQRVENIISGKRKSQNEREANLFGYTGEEREKYIAEQKAIREERKAETNKIRANLRQHLNTIRAEKQKRNQAKTQSKSRKSKNYRKTRKL